MVEKRGKKDFYGRKKREKKISMYGIITGPEGTCVFQRLQVER
jgi:hypothetical protein